MINRAKFCNQIFQLRNYKREIYNLRVVAWRYLLTFLINNNSLCEKIQISRSILIENNLVLNSPSIILSRNHFITRSLFLKWDLTWINITYNNVPRYFPKIKFHKILNDFSRKKEKREKKTKHEWNMISKSTQKMFSNIKLCSRGDQWDLIIHQNHPMLHRENTCSRYHQQTTW